MVLGSKVNKNLKFYILNVLTLIEAHIFKNEIEKLAIFYNELETSK